MNESRDFDYTVNGQFTSNIDEWVIVRALLMGDGFTSEGFLADSLEIPLPRVKRALVRLEGNGLISYALTFPDDEPLAIKE